MKNKTIVTGCNRKQAKSIALEQEARANKTELRLVATEKLAEHYKAKCETVNNRLDKSKEQLITKSKIIREAVDKNVDLAKEIGGLNKNIVSLQDQLKLREMTIADQEKEIEHISMRNENLKDALKEADRELALAKRPLYKKILRIE